MERSSPFPKSSVFVANRKKGGDVFLEKIDFGPHEAVAAAIALAYF